MVLNRTPSSLKRTIAVAVQSMIIAVVIVVFAVPYALVDVGQSALALNLAATTTALVWPTGARFVDPVASPRSTRILAIVLAFVCCAVVTALCWREIGRMSPARAHRDLTRT